jgi:hypothetical protein
MRQIPATLSSGDKRQISLFTEDLRGRIASEQSLPCQQNQHDLHYGNHLTLFICLEVAGDFLGEGCFVSGL